MAYDNTNRGILGKNKRKTQDTHPPYSGSINIEGREYWLSAWIKCAKDNPNERFFSLSVKPKEAKQGSRPPENRPAPDDDDSSDILL